VLIGLFLACVLQSHSFTKYIAIQLFVVLIIFVPIFEADAQVEEAKSEFQRI